MSTQPSPSTEPSTAQLSAIVEVAQQIAGVAAFIKNEFCHGHLAASMPLHTFMKDSVERLHSYGWPLVTKLEPRKAHLPWDLRTMDAEDAFQAMTRLADFFEQRAIDNPHSDRDDAALAADLRFLSRYTSMVTVSTKEAPLAGPPSPPKSPLDGLSVLSRAAFVVDQSQTSSTPAPEESEELSQPPESAIRETIAIPTTESGPTTRASSPHDLRPLPDDIDHSNHALKGRRLRRRSWFQDDAEFLELIGDDHKQWIAPAPAVYATIGGGQGAFACWHYIDASVLGISAVTVIKLEHPLNAKEVRAIDIDILRFVRLMLYDWVGGHLRRSDRKAEKKSLEIVRRELASRAWQKKRNNTSAANTPELIASPPAAAANIEGRRPLRPPSIAEHGTTNVSNVATNSAPLGYYPSCSYAVNPDHPREGAEAAASWDHVQSSQIIVPNAAREERESEGPASVPDLLTPKPDLRSLRGANETRVDSVDLQKSAKLSPSYIGLNGFRCQNASCSYCMMSSGAANHHESATNSISRSAPSSESIDTNDLGNATRYVHFKDPIAKVERLSPKPSAPKEPIAVDPVLLQEPQRPGVVDGNSSRNSTKAPSKPAVGSVGDMTELLPRSRCAALGLPTHTTPRPCAEQAQVLSESDSEAMEYEIAEETETDSLRQRINDLEAQVASLQQALSEPRLQTALQEPAEPSQNTPRIEEEPKHPLQHLIGSRDLSISSSQNGTAGSDAELSDIYNKEPQFYSHDLFYTAEDPISGHWVGPLDGIKITTTSTGGRTVHSVSNPNTNHIANLGKSLWRGESWKHGFGGYVARDQARAAEECQDHPHLTNLFEGEAGFRGVRGASSEERASAMAESGLVVDDGAGSLELKSSRGRPRIENEVVMGDADD